MAALSLDMKDASKSIKSEMYWRNWKFKVLMVVLVIVLIYVVLAMFCGGFTLSGCF